MESVKSINQHRLGAHVSIAGGITNAFERIEKIGGNCFQMFAASPRDWKTPSISDETIDAFLKLKTEQSIDPIYFHANYLINLAATNYVGELSVKSLSVEMNLAGRLHVRGIVIHLGSYFDLKSQTSPVLSREKYHGLFQNIWDILSNTPEEVMFIIENAGVKKIGTTLDEIGFIAKNVHSDRVKVCIDTCHLHAAGYDLNSIDGLNNFLDEFDSKIGIERLELFHSNDSKDNRGSFRDRHANLGEGTVGMETFENLLNNDKTKHIPFIIETPGFDDKGPDKENLDILKKLTRF